MKNHTRIIACFTAICVLVSSCSKLVHSHEDFMDRLNTKNDVFQHLGYPDQFRDQNNMSEWLYKLDDQKKLTTKNPEPVSKKRNTGEGEKVGQFDELKGKYVLITFKNDTVTNKQTQGVDFALKRTRVIASILAGAGLGLGILILSAAITEQPDTW